MFQKNPELRNSESVKLNQRENPKLKKPYNEKCFQENPKVINSE